MTLCMGLCMHEKVIPFEIPKNVTASNYHPFMLKTQKESGSYPINQPINQSIIIL